MRSDDDGSNPPAEKIDADFALPASSRRTIAVRTACAHAPSSPHRGIRHAGFSPPGRRRRHRIRASYGSRAETRHPCASTRCSQFAMSLTSSAQTE